MALEEEIWFSAEEEAQECSKIFKKLNISSHIRVKTDLENRIQYKGPYTALKGIIDEEITRLQEMDENEDEEFITIFQEMLDYLKSERDLLEKTFAEKKPGDHISSMIFNFLIKDGSVPDSEEQMVALLKEATVTRLLELNNLIDIDEEGVILARTISPDDAVLAIFEDDIPPLREDALKKWDIKRSLETRDIVSYIVTTSPDIVFLEDITEIEEFFTRIEYDSETLFFFINLQVKQVLVAELLSLMQKEGKLSKDELIAEFLHRELPIENENMSIGLHLSPNYISSILDDLKKTGVLKGKDSKLKIGI